jgi:RNA ligase
MLLHDLFDRNLLARHLAEGLVSRQVHPDHPSLVIYNYTAAAQYSQSWDAVTKQCRGLIVDERSGRVVARPFPKFFNADEHTADELPLHRPFEVLDKLDGSLGIVYPTPVGGWAVATRGSFASEQALHASAVFHNKYAHLQIPSDQTYLFEIIYPGNRIVVDYGDRDDLVLLAIIQNDSGADCRIPSDWPGPVALRRPATSFVTLRDELARADTAGTAAEGVVVRFVPDASDTPSLRVKLKMADYVRLHRLITGVSSVTIWEALSSGQSMAEWLEHVPDEFYAWVRLTAGQLQDSFDAIEQSCRSVVAHPMAAPDRGRKAVAQFFASQPHRAVLFKMFDAKPYADIIWKSIRPTYSRPMRIDADG